MSGPSLVWQATLAREFRALSTADRFVDAIVVNETTTQRCCDRPATVFMVFDEWSGLREHHWELELCPECARRVIEETDATYLDVEVRIPVGEG